MSAKRQTRSAPRRGDDGSAQSPTAERNATGGAPTSPTAPADKGVDPAFELDLRRIQWLRYDDAAGVALLRKTGASKQNSLSLLKWQPDEWATLRAELVDLQRRTAAFTASLKPLAAPLDAPDSVPGGRLLALWPKRVPLDPPVAMPLDPLPVDAALPPITPGEPESSAMQADDDAAARPKAARVRTRGSGSSVPPPSQPQPLSSSSSLQPPASTTLVAPPSSQASTSLQVPVVGAAPVKAEGPLRKRRRSEDPAVADGAAPTSELPVVKTEVVNAASQPPVPAEHVVKVETTASLSTAAAAAAGGDGDAAAVVRAQSLAGADALPLANAAGVPIDLEDKDFNAMRKRSAVLPHVRQQYLQRDRELGDGAQRRKRRGEGGDEDDGVGGASTAMGSGGGLGDEIGTAPLQPYGMRDADLVRPLPHNINANSFWQAIEPFFAPLTHEIAEQLLSTKPTAAEEQHFVVPPLGIAMSQSSITVIKSRSHRPDQTEAEMHAEAAAIEYWGTEACQPGELTQRLLGAFIDEYELDDTRQAALKAREAQNATYLAAQSAAAAVAGDKTDLAPLHPLAAAPVANYSTEAMLELDARVRQTLRDAALLDEPADPPLHLREDDDLCAEMRAVQRSLRERVKTNIKNKMMLAKLVAPKIEQERKHQIERQHDRATETALIAKVKAAAKRKKKPGPKKQRDGK